MPRVVGKRRDFSAEKCKTGDVSANMSYSEGPFRNFLENAGTFLQKMTRELFITVATVASSFRNFWKCGDLFTKNAAGTVASVASYGA